MNKKTICLGVTGGVAAYKAPIIARELIKMGYDVISVLTQNATNFVTPYTMETVTKNPCSVLSFDSNRVYDVEHISIANKCDIMLICPATANIIGKVANGIADDLLSTVIMAFSKTVIFAPAMNTNMYINPIVQNNIENLKKLGYKFIDPSSGYLACGDVGVGRLADIQVILDNVEYELYNNKDLMGKNILVTAGPTRELIDPVRYISNRSSGKMGYAIAKAAMLRGAKVTLVSGPTNLETPQGVEKIDVITTDEMYHECNKRFDSCDILIKAAAPSDFNLTTKYDSKIKKSQIGEKLSLEFGYNIDILKNLASKKTSQKVVGFAAETQNIEQYAKAKLVEKNLDMIVANDVTKKGAGFNTDSNIVTFYKKDFSFNFSGSKLEVAHKLIDLILENN